MTNIRLLAREKSGAAAVEFALVLLPLLLLLLGVIETGRLFWTNYALQEVAASGARCMGLRAPNCTTDEAFDDALTRNLVQDEAANWGIDISEAKITLDEEITCRSGETMFSQVQIVHEYSRILPFFDTSQVEAKACFPNQP